MSHLREGSEFGSMGTAKVNETDSREETCAAQACRLQRKKTRVPRTGPNQMLQEFQGAINGSYLRKSWGQSRDWGLRHAAFKGYAGHGHATVCNGKTF